MSYGPPLVDFYTPLSELGRGIGRIREQRRQEEQGNAAFQALADWRYGDQGAAPGVSLSALGGAPSGGNGYFDAIRSAESGGNDAARNPRSSATGRYQFTEGTWNGLAQKYPDAGLTPDGRLDPAQQERAIRLLTRDNAQGLVQAGIRPDGGSLYAAHFLGIGDAPRVLGAPDTDPMKMHVPPQVIEANPFLADMNVGQFKQWAARKGGGQATSYAPAQSNLPPREVIMALGQNPETRSIAIDMLRSARPGSGFRLETRPDGTVLKINEATGEPEVLIEADRPDLPNSYEEFQLAQANPEYGDYLAAGRSNGITIGADGSVQIGGPVKLSEQQAKYVNFGERMEGASQKIQELESQGYDPANFQDAVSREGGVVGNAFTSPEGRRYLAAGREWISGVLRLDSGAAVPEPEFWRYFKTYFPQPFDDPETVRFKAQLRENTEQAMSLAGGGMRESLKAAQPSPSAEQALGALPQGVTEADIEFTMRKHGLTREQVLERIAQ